MELHRQHLTPEQSWEHLQMCFKRSHQHRLTVWPILSCLKIILIRDSIHPLIKSITSPISPKPWKTTSVDVSIKRGLRQEEVRIVKKSYPSLKLSFYPGF